MRSQFIVAAALAILAGCKDSTTPGTFDPAAMGNKVAQAFGAVQNNKAVQGFDVMAGAFTFAGAAPTFPGTPAPAAPSAVLPANVLGKTFGYNPTSGKYQPNAETGAPADGVRYLLYAVDTVSRTVISPAQQIGTLDLTDKSSAASNSIGIKALVSGVTVVDYDANGSIGAGGTFSFAAKGNSVDGSNRLDFDISQSVSGSGAIQINVKLTSPSNGNLGVEITTTATSSAAGTSTLMVTDNADRLEIAVSTSGNTISGMAKFNGQTVANVMAVGDADPTFTGASGRTLSANDITGLKQLYQIVDLIFDRSADLLFPAYFVFGLAHP